MENSQVITGVDTNILCYALEPAYPEHEQVKDLLPSLSSENTVALNPTVLHEAYHTLVFYLEWTPEEAARKLTALIKYPYIEFFNQTKKTTVIALNLSRKHNLDGRDAFIIANFLANKIPIMLTHDKPILRIQKITWKNLNIAFQDPLTQK
jgi:predicted nucleic acid-binding protein